MNEHENIRWVISLCIVLFGHAATQCNKDKTELRIFEWAWHWLNYDPWWITENRPFKINFLLCLFNCNSTISTRFDYCAFMMTAPWLRNCALLWLNDKLFNSKIIFFKRFGFFINSSALPVILENDVVYSGNSLYFILKWSQLWYEESTKSTR